MVTLRKRRALSFIFSALFIIFFLTSLRLATAQAPTDITYTVNQEWVMVWINKDGSIDLKYNITLTYLSGEPEGIITIGMPKNGYRIDYAQDNLNNDLEVIHRTDYPGIDVSLRGPIILDKIYSLLVYAVVPDMVFNDKAGRVGMSFYPSTFPTAKDPIGNVRIAILLPEGVTTEDVEYPTGWPFDDVRMEGSNLRVYWERDNWPQTEQFKAGVSFPEEYVALGPSLWFYLIIALAILAFVGFLIIVIRRVRKAVYEKPRISVEALGSARGLMAVEAAVVLGLKPVKTLTMILFGLLRKRFVAVNETTPLIRLEIIDTALREKIQPRYYEIDFLKAIKTDGSLDDRILARTYLSLRDNVDRKLRGYSRVDTVNYYKSIVAAAWNQVAQAGTPQLKGDALESNMEWLLMDQDYNAKFRNIFPSDMIILPRAGWWWYWHGPYIPKAPEQTIPTRIPTEIKPIPAQEWANNVVQGIELTANNIVKNIEEFTNRLIAPPIAQSSRPVRQGSSCVCACANCACACACVSCACACAGGGAR